MKRSVQMKKAGVPDQRKGRPPIKMRKDWRGNEPIIHLKPLKAATAAFLLEGSEGAIRILGSRSKYVVLSPQILARAKAWERAARHMENFNE